MSGVPRTIDIHTPMRPERSRFDDMRPSASGNPSGNAISRVKTNISSEVPSPRRRSSSIDENVIRECQTAVEYVPDEPALFYYLGLAQYINKRDNDAIASLKRGASMIKSETSKEMAADIYGLLGDIYQKIGRIHDTYIAYDSCLVYNPDKVLCLNNYAYFLSLEGKDLKKAEKMSYRAITVEPNNATYLDTYAWILYKQKRYEDAKAYIDMALEHLKEGDDPDGEIAKHAEKINKKLKK